MCKSVTDLNHSEYVHNDLEDISFSALSVWENPQVGMYENTQIQICQADADMSKLVTGSWNTTQIVIITY